MSAFIVSDKQISAILQGVYGSTHAGFNVWQFQDDPDSYHYVMNAGKVQQQEANILMAENIRSVNHRYQMEGKLTAKLVGNVLLDRTAKPYPALDVLKMITCLQYQSCECDNYRETEAYKLLCNYREIVTPKLEGWNDAKWSI